MQIAKHIFFYAAIAASGFILWMMLERSFFNGSISYQVFSTVGGLAILLAGMYFGRNMFTKTVVQKEIIEKEVFVPFNMHIAENNLLSAREAEILLLMSRGLTNEQIGKELFISLNTVKTHLAKMYSKLDVKNRTSAIARAKELKILV